MLLTTTSEQDVPARHVLSEGIGWDEFTGTRERHVSSQHVTHSLVTNGVEFVSDGIHHFKQWWDDFRHEFSDGFHEMTEDLQDFADLMLRTMEESKEASDSAVASTTKTFLESLPRLGPFRQYVDARQQLEIASETNDRKLLEFAREEYVAACLGILGEVPSPLSPVLFLIGIHHNLHTWMDPEHEHKDVLAAVADLAVENRAVRHLVDRLLSWHESGSVKHWLASVERLEDSNFSRSSITEA
jgi:hypothetical protein